MTAGCGPTTYLPVQNSVMDTIQCLKMSTHEVPVTSDESGSRNAGSASHLFSDGSCVRRTRIQWTSALDTSLLTINSSCGAPGSKGRTTRLLTKWLEVHPDMPSMSGPLNQRLLRVRAKNKAQPLCVQSPEVVGQPQPTSATPSAKRTLKEDSLVQSSVLEEGVPPSAPGAEPPSSFLPLTNKRPEYS